MNFREVRDTLGLRGQFVLLVSAVIIGIALSVGMFLIGQIESVYRDGLSLRSSQLAENLAYNSEFATLIGSHEELLKVVEGAKRDTLLDYVRVYKDDFRVLFEDGIVSNIAAMLNDSTVFVTKSMGPENVEPILIWQPDGRMLHISAPILRWESELDRERLGSLETGASYQDQGHWVSLGRVIVGIDLEPMNRTISRVRTTAIIIVLLLALIAIFVTALFVRLIMKPIEKLAEMTDEISQGQLDQKLGSDRRDEFGLLAHSFDRMVDSLRLSRQEVEEYQATLEDKIRERTIELEEAQNQLLQSEKMSAVGQLAAGVAHELNNPLAGILGYSQFALEKLEGCIPGEVSKADMEGFTRYLCDIEAQARRCKTIVQNLLKFSRSSDTLEVAPFSLNAALQETVELLRHQLEMNQIKIITSYDETMPIAKGNVGRIQQVFTNLIINAMHATAPGGEIRISSRNSPKLGEFDGALEVIVEDTGYGIPEELVGKIFEPFFTTKEVGKGTGLGLSVSYGIICDHGGEIRVHSAVGEGSRFEIILPIQKSGERADTKKTD